MDVIGDVLILSKREAPCGVEERPRAVHLEPPRAVHILYVGTLALAPSHSTSDRSSKSDNPPSKNGCAFPRRRRHRRAIRRAAPAAVPYYTLQRRPAAVDEEQQRQGRAREGARGGRRGGGGQHVPHRRRRGRGARRHRLPHLLLSQGHVPRVRRRRLRAQVRLDAARERGEEGPAADRLRQLQRPRQARPGRQVDRLLLSIYPSIHIPGTTRITGCAPEHPSSSLFRQSFSHRAPMRCVLPSFYMVFIRLVFLYIYICTNIVVHALCCVTCGVSMSALVVL